MIRTRETPAMTTFRAVSVYRTALTGALRLFPMVTVFSEQSKDVTYERRNVSPSTTRLSSMGATPIVQRPLTVHEYYHGSSSNILSSKVNSKVYIQDQMPWQGLSVKHSSSSQVTSEMPRIAFANRSQSTDGMRIRLDPVSKIAS